MNRRDADEARALFEDAEGEADPAGKLDALVESLALVDEIVGDAEIPESTKAIARNIRRSHLRKLLYQLFAMRNIDFLQWFSYMRALLVDRRAVIAEILESDSSLKYGYDGFVTLYRQQFKDALGKDLADL